MRVEEGEVLAEPRLPLRGLLVAYEEQRLLSPECTASAQRRMLHTERDRLATKVDEMTRALHRLDELISAADHLRDRLTRRSRGRARRRPG
ncbi:hypothetical protein [Saccharopolyspora shandongensis]|uniref:hypothetical protein n=1 Tax=Saccharopolyspora shandongensis TaxID=418495 RepID=UPI001FE9DFE2|nr:hypothetical protein [Saccharopolyspora shandongensis]